MDLHIYSWSLGTVDLLLQLILLIGNYNVMETDDYQKKGWFFRFIGSQNHRIPQVGRNSQGSGWILGKTSSLKSGDALHRLLRELGGSPSSEMIRNLGGVALRDMVSGHGGVGWGWAWGSERSFRPQ